MAENVRWGILGPGGIAHAFVSDLLLTGRTVTAVGSRSAAGAEAFAAQYDIPHVHVGYESLVADPEVDIIYVATPHTFHAEQALLALRAGKHVLVEKPFTLSAAEAREVAEVAAETGRVLLEAMWTRFLPHMVRIREIIEAGTLGQVRTLIADHNQKLPANPEHRLQNPDLGGGALLDLGIYPVSFAWDLFGAPQSIQANGSFTATGVDRQTAAIFSYSDGQQAVLHTALDTFGPNTATIIGTEGSIEIDRVWYTATSFTVLSSSGEVLERFENTVEGRGMQYQAFEAERLIREGLTESPLLPVAETVAIMASLDEIRRQIGLRYPGE